MAATGKACLPTTSSPLTQDSQQPPLGIGNSHTSAQPHMHMVGAFAAVSKHQPTTPSGLSSTKQPTQSQEAPLLGSHTHTHTKKLNTRPARETMKREGWQHGTVRVSRSKVLRVAAAADGEEAAAVGAVVLGKAPVKPTNASKSTGKCRRPRCAGCHYHPVTKARDKAKGAHKLRACDVALNHRLVSWRVVDGGGAAGTGGVPDYKGASASAVLAYLAGSGSRWHEDDDDGAGGAFQTTPPANGGLSDLYDLIVGCHAATPAGKKADLARATDIAVEDTDAIEEQEQDGDDDKEDEEEQEDMGFCMVGITIALEFSDGEEDWIVVEEI